VHVFSEEARSPRASRVARRGSRTGLPRCRSTGGGESVDGADVRHGSQFLRFSPRVGWSGTTLPFAANRRLHSRRPSVHERHQAPHDAVPEHHVKQQLPIRPPGADRRATQIVGASGVQQGCQFGNRLRHLAVDRRAQRGQLLTPQVTTATHGPRSSHRLESVQALRRWLMGRTHNLRIESRSSPVVPVVSSCSVKLLVGAEAARARSACWCRVASLSSLAGINGVRCGVRWLLGEESVFVESRCLDHENITDGVLHDLTRDRS
jgi:hypothetical protein